MAETSIKLDRTVVKKSSLRHHEDNNFVSDTASNRLLMVWPITQEIVSLGKMYDVERRLQRDVVALIKREC